MEKYLFVDRDGTILVEPLPDRQIDSIEKFDFLPEAISALRRIARETDYRLVMVSNQDGLGTDSFPEEDFWPLQKLMERILASEGVVFDDVLIDPSFEEQNSPNRKPRTGMVEKYLTEELDRENSWVIGDRETDMQLAKNMGIRGLRLDETRSWGDVADILCNTHRCATVERKTKETDITVTLDLDAEGRSEVSTGIGFFDHMLDQIALHGGFSLTIKATGDLHVDAHHTIEDTGMVLGEALRQALGDKRGIKRYAFALPMDEAEAEVLLDLGGRSYLVWDARFSRDFAGDFPADMTRHFFDSLSRAAGCTLNIKARGENTHHTIEAIFKAFARCLRTAVKREGASLPSTKGTM